MGAISQFPRRQRPAFPATGKWQVDSKPPPPLPQSPRPRLATQGRRFLGQPSTDSQQQTAPGQEGEGQQLRAPWGSHSPSCSRGELRAGGAGPAH